MSDTRHDRFPITANTETTARYRGTIPDVRAGRKTLGKGKKRGRDEPGPIPDKLGQKSYRTLARI